MNVQTERLENHTARLTVEVEPKQWENAKKEAARLLSQRYRIPGFRKGKAPYSVILRYIGEAPIIESAMETLGNTIYKDALDQSEVNPYTSGSLEDFQLEPQPTYIFTVPLQPEIDLADYRAVRLDYETPELTEKQVDEALRSIQQQRAVVEDSEEAIKAGDRVVLDIHSEFADGEEPADDADDEERTESDTPRKGDNFFHRHDQTVNLDPEMEPLLPGFIAAMVGAKQDEDVEFELTVPDDDEDYKTIAGRKVHFHVTVKSVKSVTLPELSDELANQVTEDEEEPLTLAQLRERVRGDLEKDAIRTADNKYANKVLDTIVEQAAIVYPETMVAERINEMIDELGEQLKQQGMTLETYQKVTGITRDQLEAQYHDDAVKNLRRSLVLGEVLVTEGVSVNSADITEKIDETLAQFGEQAEALRSLFDTPQQRESIANNLLYERVMERLAKIGKGEPLDEVVDAEPVDDTSDAGETPAEESTTDE